MCQDGQKIVESQKRIKTLKNEYKAQYQNGYNQKLDLIKIEIEIKKSELKALQKAWALTLQSAEILT
ncbi:MAG: hypothetical protein ACK41T_11665 [Pseudobdellovibrio sp.]